MLCEFQRHCEPDFTVHIRSLLVVSQLIEAPPMHPLQDYRSVGDTEERGSRGAA